MSRTSTESGPPANAQIMTTVTHCARSPATTLHVHEAQTPHGKTISTMEMTKNSLPLLDLGLKISFIKKCVHP